jgi:hypothetical protein
MCNEETGFSAEKPILAWVLLANRGSEGRGFETPQSPSFVSLGRFLAGLAGGVSRNRPLVHSLHSSSRELDVLIALSGSKPAGCDLVRLVCRRQPVQKTVFHFVGSVAIFRVVGEIRHFMRIGLQVV